MLVFGCVTKVFQHAVGFAVLQSVVAASAAQAPIAFRTQHEDEVQIIAAACQSQTLQRWKNTLCAPLEVWQGTEDSFDYTTSSDSELVFITPEVNHDVCRRRTIT